MQRPAVFCPRVYRPVPRLPSDACPATAIHPFRPGHANPLIFHASDWQSVQKSYLCGPLPPAETARQMQNIRTPYETDPQANMDDRLPDSHQPADGEHDRADRHGFSRSRGRSRAGSLGPRKRILSGDFHARIRFRNRGSDSDCAAQRRESLCPDRAAVPARTAVPAVAGDRDVRHIAHVHSDGAALADQFRRSVRGCRQLHELARVRILFRIRRHHVPGVLRRDHEYENADAELDRHGTVERRTELRAGFRQAGPAGHGHRRSGDRLVGLGDDLDGILHRLYSPEDRSSQIRAVPLRGILAQAAAGHAERLGMDDDPDVRRHLDMVSLFHRGRASGRAPAGRHEHHPQRVGHRLRHRQLVRLDGQHAREQPNGSRTA